MADNSAFPRLPVSHHGIDPKILGRALPGPQPPAFEALLRRGIARAQAVSGEVWTDYNEHDPGVTILEQLCFALTDLAYRTEHPMRDLMASVPLGPVSNAAAHAALLSTGPPVGFHSTGALFSTSPITIDDLRRTVLDEFPEVRNIWIRKFIKKNCSPPKPAPEQCGSGDSGRDITLRTPLTFEVLLQRSSDPADQQRNLSNLMLREAVWQLLQTEACLGMAFQQPQILEDAPLALSADIYIDSAAGGDAATLISRLLFRIDEAINPQPRMTGYGDLLQEGKFASPAEVFEGPLCRHGYIDLSTTSKWPKAPDSDEIRAALLHTPGVAAVSAVQTLGAVSAGKAYRLSASFEGLEHVAILRDNHPLFAEVTVQTEHANAFFADVERRIIHQRRQFRFSGPSLGGTRRTIEPPSAPAGEKRSGLGVYRSVQHLFPAIYGLGIYGDPTVNISGETLSRADRDNAQAQLQAYLLLMEQFLANYLSQLANAPRLLSWHEGWECSYYVQPVVSVYETPIGSEADEPPRSSTVIAAGADGDTAKQRLEAFDEALREENGKFDLVDARAEKAYDHLLARVNERFANGVLENLGDVRGGSKIDNQIERNKRKRVFLEKYGLLGTRRAAAARAPAFDNETPVAGKEPPGFALARFRGRPALAERIELLTGLNRGSIRLVDHAQLGVSPDDNGVGALMIWPLSEAGRKNFQPAFQVGPASFAVPLSADGKVPPVLLLVHPDERGNFLKTVAEGDVLVEVDPGRRGGRFGIAVLEEATAYGGRILLAKSLNITSSQAEAEEMAAKTAEALGRITGEPKGWQHPMGFNAFPARFYDRRLTMFLSKTEETNPSVRDFVERVFREEAPAHLTLDVFWVDDNALAIADRGLREIYRWWPDEGAKRLRWMIEHLFVTRMFSEQEAG